MAVADWWLVWLRKWKEYTRVCISSARHQMLMARNLNLIALKNTFFCAYLLKLGYKSKKSLKNTNMGFSDPILVALAFILALRRTASNKDTWLHHFCHILNTLFTNLGPFRPIFVIFLLTTSIRD